MSKSVVLVYQTDVWHSHSSKVLISVATSKEMAITLINTYVWNKYKAILSEYDIDCLTDMGQTQSSSDEPNNPFEGEFMIEEVQLNTLDI